MNSASSTRYSIYTLSQRLSTLILDLPGWILLVRDAREPLASPRAVHPTRYITQQRWRAQGRRCVRRRWRRWGQDRR